MAEQGESQMESIEVPRETHIILKGLLSELNEHLERREAHAEKITRRLKYAAILIGTLAVFVGGHMAVLVYRMADDMHDMRLAMDHMDVKWMQSMAGDMGQMNDAMGAMAGDMQNMRASMGSMKRDIGTMTVSMEEMNGDMDAVVGMRQDVNVMSRNVGGMRYATAVMRQGVSNMSSDTGAMGHPFRVMDSVMPW